MYALRTPVLCLLLVFLASACGRAGTTGDPASLSPATERTTVEVTNYNWATMVLYAVRDGLRVRLGTVETGSTERFRLPPAVMGGTGGIQLVADPIGSRVPYVTDPIQVTAGQQIEFNIENHLAVSTVSVWDRRRK